MFALWRLKSCAWTELYSLAVWILQSQGKQVLLFRGNAVGLKNYKLKSTVIHQSLEKIQLLGPAQRPWEPLSQWLIWRYVFPKHLVTQYFYVRYWNVLKKSRKKETLNSLETKTKWASSAMSSRIVRGGHWKVDKAQLNRWLPTAYYYFFYGALGSLFPFINLFYRAVGLEPWQIGILGGMRPLIALLCAPFWSYISNKYRVRKLVLLLSLASWIACTLPIAFVEHSKSAVCLHRENSTNSDLVELGTSFKTLSFNVGIMKRKQLKVQTTPLKSRRLLGLENAVLKSFGKLQKSFVDSFAPSGIRLSSVVEIKKLRKKPYDFRLPGQSYMNSRNNPYASTIFREIFILVLIGELFQCPTDDLNTHFDGTFLEHLGILLQNVNRNNLYSAFSICFLAFLTGLILRYAPKNTICGQEHGDYRIAFYIFAFLMLASLLTSTRFDFIYRRKRRNFEVKESLRKLCHFRHWGFGFIVLGMGIFRGVLFNFLYWNLSDIGGSDLVVGATVVCQYLSDTIMNISSQILMTYFGYVGMIFCGLASYALRFLIYSWLSTGESAWVAPPIELLQGISHATAWSAFMLYITNYTSRSTFPTGIFLLQGIYLGVGGAIGGILGGVMIQYFDTTMTFRLFGWVCVFTCLIFVLVMPSGMSESLPGEVDTLSYFTDEYDYSSYSEDELFDINTRGVTYIPSRGDQEPMMKNKKAPLPSEVAPFVPTFLALIAKEEKHWFWDTFFESSPSITGSGG